LNNQNSSTATEKEGSSMGMFTITLPTLNLTLIRKMRLHPKVVEIVIRKLNIIFTRKAEHNQKRRWKIE